MALLYKQYFISIYIKTKTQQIIYVYTLNKKELCLICLKNYKQSMFNMS